MTVQFTIPTVSGSTFTINGDIRGDDIVVGYVYTMDIELPKFFRQETAQGSASSDFTNDLIIHRIKVSTGLSGPITYRIDIDGIDSTTRLLMLHSLMSITLITST